MNELLAPPSPVEHSVALKARAEVDALLTRIHNHQVSLEASYVSLGQRLLDIDTGKYWTLWADDSGHSFHSFSGYLTSIAPRINKGRTQLYNYRGVAADLLPLLPESTLVEIGISNANVLRSAVKDGRTLTPELVETARTQTREVLEAAVAEATGLHLPPQLGGKWLSLGMLKLTSEKEDYFLRAVRCALQTYDKTTAVENWADWLNLSPSVKEEIILDSFCAEFLSSHEAGQ